MQSKKFFSFALLFFFSIVVFGQFGQPAKERRDDFKLQKRIYFGGGFDFAISSYGTVLGISPLVGYRVSPSFDVGARVTYNYYSYNDDFIKYSTNNYGGGAFARYYLFFFNDLFLHAEYEALNYEWPQYVQPNGDVVKTRDWVSSLFVGGGYRQWIGQSAFVNITVLWNVLDDINSPYSNPIFRIGFGVGL